MAVRGKSSNFANGRLRMKTFSYSDIQTFFELLRAGLFSVHGEGGMGCDSLFKDVDWGKVYQLAQEQSVQGLVLQGIDMVNGSRFTANGEGGMGNGYPLVPRGLLLQWIGEVQMIEQRNKEMNVFVAELMEKLRGAGIYTLLVKGQGVAQCYEKPLWRACGDVDLLLNDSNYEKAKEFLTPLAEKIEEENEKRRHFAMTIDGWSVELHGTLHGSIKRIDRVIDEVQHDVFRDGNVRSWQNGNTEVLLPRADEDVIFVFTHILQHFYVGGIGLRQICDWCRLLYTYKASLNCELLESRIRKAGIMTEWEAFGAFAIEYLGMPVEAMPFIDVRGKKEEGRCEIDKRLKRKADRVLKLVLESGNFGRNRDFSYKQKYPFVIRYAMSFWLYTKLAMQRFAISPRNAILAWWSTVKIGAGAAVKAVRST